MSPAHAYQDEVLLGVALAAAFTVALPCPLDHRIWLSPGAPRRPGDPEPDCAAAVLLWIVESGDLAPLGEILTAALAESYGVRYDCGAERHDLDGTVVIRDDRGRETSRFTFRPAGPPRLVYEYATFPADPAPGDWLDRPEILDRPARTSLESTEPEPLGADLSPGLTAEEILGDVDRYLARIEEEDRVRDDRTRRDLRGP